MTGCVEGIHRTLVLGLVLIAGTAIGQAPSVGPLLALLLSEIMLKVTLLLIYSSFPNILPTLVCRKTVSQPGYARKLSQPPRYDRTSSLWVFHKEFILNPCILHSENEMLTYFFHRIPIILRDLTQECRKNL